MHMYVWMWFCLVSLFNGILAFVFYLMPTEKLCIYIGRERDRDRERVCVCEGERTTKIYL